VQNGVGNEELVAEHVREVIRGTTFPAGHIVEPGHVGWDTKGDTHIGPFEPSPAPMDKVRELADACTRAGMPTHALEDARGAQWRKLIFNAASNAIGALTGFTHGRIAEFPPTRALAWNVMAEGRAVSDAQGIVLDLSPEDLFDHAARRDVAYDHKPSMLQDVEAGRETEIDFLNGAIVAFGEQHGVDAPLNRALTALIKGIEEVRA
jgi:2-dehydropantoate 2-reductase